MKHYGLRILNPSIIDGTLEQKDVDPEQSVMKLQKAMKKSSKSRQSSKMSELTEVQEVVSDTATVISGGDKPASLKSSKNKLPSEMASMASETMNYGVIKKADRTKNKSKYSLTKVEMSEISSVKDDQSHVFYSQEELAIENKSDQDECADEEQSVAAAPSEEVSSQEDEEEKNRN